MSKSEALHEQFEDIYQQRTAATFGLWVFLATEVLFFGGLFMGYTVYRLLYPHAFAIASKETEWWIGATNLAILITSSFTISMGVRAGEHGRILAAEVLILITAFLGAAFLMLKGYEYYLDIMHHLVPGSDFDLSPPATQIFWSFYWIMTALHAIHLTTAVGIMLTVWWNLHTRAFVPRHQTTLKVAGLYWHFVDIIWIFLYPTLYLIGRTQ